MTDDQKLIEKFLARFTSEITAKFADKIDFILLFGSAARGEFVKGASDVDLIIQAKNNSDVQAIENQAEKIFWSLDKKYNLDFKKSLSIAETRNPIEHFLHGIEAKAHLFKPIFVFGPNDLDWQNATLYTKRLDWAIGSTFLVSLATTFLKMKREGKILYGRDIRAEIKPKFNFWERWKGIWLPFYLAVISIFIFPVSPKEGLKLATKAVFWQIDAVLLYLGKVVFGKKEQLLKILEKQLKIPLAFANYNLKLMPKWSTSVVYQASEIRKRNFTGSYLEGFAFCFKALIFVVITGWIANFRLIFQLVFSK